MIQIRPALQTDHDGIWCILEPIIRAGEVFAWNRDMTRDQALDAWISPESEVFVAEEHGQVVGAYYLRPNQKGGGSHVCNGGYATAQAAMGRGIAGALCEHSLHRAKQRGFRAMQFNFVVSTNERAVRLWKKLGFETVGRLPGAFEHPTLGYVDAFVMYRTL